MNNIFGDDDVLRIVVTKASTIKMDNTNFTCIDNNSRNISILLNDIKRIEVLDAMGFIVDVWGNKVKDSEEINRIKSIITSLDQIDFNEVLFIYVDNSQVKSKKINDVRVIKLDGNGLFVDEVYIKNNNLFYILPMNNDNSLINNQIITVNKYEGSNEDNPFINPNSYIKQYINR